jgi:hypothetical protein
MFASDRMSLFAALAEQKYQSGKRRRFARNAEADGTTLRRMQKASEAIGKRIAWAPEALPPALISIRPAGPGGLDCI